MKDLMEIIMSQAEAKSAEGISPAMIDRIVSPQQMLELNSPKNGDSNQKFFGLRKEKPAFTEELFTEPYTYESNPNPRHNRGFKMGASGSKRSFSNRTLDKSLSTRRHEAEHVLRNMGGAPDYMTQFNKNSGKSGSHAEMLGVIKNKISSLKEKYPDWDWKAGYLNYADMDRAVFNPEAFEEVLADMAAFEKHQQAKGKPFEWHKEYPEAFIKGSQEAYKSLTGLRQTITDPKDIPAQSVDTGKQWYRK